MNQEEIDMRVRAWAEQRRLLQAHLERWLSQAVDARKILLELAEGLSLRTGQFVTIYELIDEIGVREKMGVGEVLAIPALAQILAGEGSGPGRAANGALHERGRRVEELERFQLRDDAFAPLGDHGVRVTGTPRPET